MEGKIDIKLLIKKLFSSWYYFVITALVLLPLAYLYVNFTDNVYQIRASILLASEEKGGTRSEKFLKGMELLTPNTEIEDEIGILKSYNLVGRAIRKLDFGISYFEKQNFRTVEKYGEDRPFTVEMDSTTDQIVNVPIYIKRTSDTTYNVTVSADHPQTYNFYTNKPGRSGAEIDIDSTVFVDEAFKARNLSFRAHFGQPHTADESFNTSYFIVIHNLAGVTESYQHKLDIKPISRESNIVEIMVKGKISQKEILFLNTLLDVYLINELSKRNQLGLKTIKFIDDQLSGVSDELQQVESSLESFRSRNNILDIDATAENLTKNLNRLEIDKSMLESKLKYYKYIARSLDDKVNPKSIQAPSTFGLEDPFLNDLLLEYARLNQERTGLNYSTRQGNPVIEVIDLKIANNKKALIENVTNFIEASSMALEDLNQQIAEIHLSLKGLPRSEREMVSIQRKFEFNDNVYNYLLEKRAEAGIAIASNTVEKTIVDPAQQVGPGPVSPNKNAILFVAALLSMFVAVGLIVVKDVVNDNIISTQDLERSTNIPFIGTITHGSRRDCTSAIVAHTRSALGESFRSLRVNLQYLTLGQENHVIGITSSVPSEGKTFCSSNLAVAMAQSGRKTILIDADLRRPRVAATFNLNNEKGLSNYLIGSCSLAEVTNPTATKSLHVITSGPIPPNPLDLIGLAKMDELINNLKKTYDTIIIDSPPIGAVAEYIILMKYTNATICVVRSNYTHRTHLEKINRLYDEKKIANVSILLNDAKTSLNGYYYSYGK
ncbi:MAG: polysaccharide biosynthesis tyrosine autokinase [Cyclobacteriaceae bacterium]